MLCAARARVYCLKMTDGLRTLLLQSRRTPRSEVTVALTCFGLGQKVLATNLSLGNRKHGGT